MDDVLTCSGTCTGEHGIGQDKVGGLEQEHGDLIPLTGEVKHVFDPHGIMNPGKVLPAVAYTPPGAVSSVGRAGDF